ncbi:hypothetical protein OIU34_23970 [Pararhizobium sp. BT-229]|uniref:hypothetical protein n=1 Tax=Pararhizobium sp. BT-229 TaxID=2986923 RepID=UPI0021F7C42B|nr:hypothetical protein [Pararhizobium sp. BT-229]MCV9964956.1 hypothetical protein [Pararhizobium sp. BT-229]
MATELEHFDYDQFSDNVRSSIRFALRDEQVVANALTFAQGEALVQKLTSIASAEARKMLQPYLAGIEEIVEKLEKADVSKQPGNLPL